MSLTLWEFKNILKREDFLLFNGIHKYLVVENKIILKKIQKILTKKYKFSELSNLMKYLLNEKLREEIINIHNNGIIQCVDGYMSNCLVGDLNYKLPLNIDFSKAINTNISSKNIFPYEDSFALINFNNITEVTPGFSLEKRNIKTDNGNDWIRHYIGRNEKGYIYKLKCEKDGIIFYKVGISKNLETRKIQLSKNIKILETEYEEDFMIINAIKERAYHENNIHRKLHFSEKFDGCNECYVLNLNIPSLKDSLKILEFKYSISTNIIKLILKEMGCLKEL